MYSIKINNISTSYYYNGKLHREFGPAFYKDGSNFWFKGGILHRDNGPAVEYKEGKEIWFRDGKIHREDGPATIFYSDEEWFVDGVKYKKNEYLIALIRYKMRKH